MSTKKEKCCEKCLSTNGWMKGECFNGNCTCHQSESIEWEKFAEKVSENFDSIYRKFPANEAAVIIRNRIKNSFPSLISQAITTAVEARERGIIEKVESERLSPSNYEQKTNEVKIKQREAYNKALDKVISIINTSKE